MSNRVSRSGRSRQTNHQRSREEYEHIIGLISTIDIISLSGVGTRNRLTAIHRLDGLYNTIHALSQDNTMDLCRHNEVSCQLALIRDMPIDMRGT